MPTINFIAHNGTTYCVEVKSGTTLMRAATDHGVPGIDGDCGGACACATCHVYIEPPWSAVTGRRNANEDDMLNFSAGLRDTSRLACQIPVTEALDGIVVHLPEGQH